MRKFLILAAAVLTIPSLAQAAKSNMANEVKIFVTPQVTLPMGDFADGAGIGIGATVGAAYSLRPEFALTLRIGYNSHLEESHVQYSSLPILLGLQYELVPQLHGLVELGYVTSYFDFDLGPLSDSRDTSEFGGGIGLGYDFGPVMGTLMLATPNLTGEGDALWSLLVGAQIPLTSFGF